MNTPPEHFPITGMCIVADPTKCPPGYECIYVSKDRKEDCDLWKDSFFKTRVTRYICFTRVYPLDSGRLNNVLCDVVINNERDPPPSGFTLLDFTLDTREKATRKKQICVKMLPRHITNDAISDLIILSKSKRAPPEYTLIGEMNGMALCFKMSPVPTDTQTEPPAPQRAAPAVPPSPAYSYSNSHSPYSPGQGWPSSPAANSASYHPWSNSQPAPTSYGQNEHRKITKQDSLILPYSALVGVPFQLNARFQDMDGLRQFSAPEIHYRSLVDIENEYNYPFRIEHGSRWTLNHKKNRFTIIRDGLTEETRPVPTQPSCLNQEGACADQDIEDHGISQDKDDTKDPSDLQTGDYLGDQDNVGDQYVPGDQNVPGESPPGNLGIAQGQIDANEQGISDKQVILKENVDIDPCEESKEDGKHEEMETAYDNSRLKSNPDSLFDDPSYFDNLTLSSNTLTKQQSEPSVQIQPCIRRSKKHLEKAVRYWSSTSEIESDQEQSKRHALSKHLYDNVSVDATSAKYDGQSVELPHYENVDMVPGGTEEEEPLYDEVIDVSRTSWEANQL